MSEDKSKIQLFDGKNYNDWKFRMEIFLDKEDLLDVVREGYVQLAKAFEILPGDGGNARKRKEEGLIELTKKDKRCKNSIIERLGDEVLEIVKEKKYAMDVWQVLSERFSCTQASSRIVKSKQFHSIRYKPKEESLVEYSVRFDKLVRELKMCGCTMDDIGIVLQYLWSLPPEFEAVVNSLQALDQSQLTLNMVRLRVEEFDLLRAKKAAAVTVPKATSSAYSARGSSRGGAEQAYFRYNCNNCGLKGHKKSNCTAEGGDAYHKNRFNNNRRRGGRGGYPAGRGRGGYQGGRGGNQDGRGRGKVWHRGNQGYRGSSSRGHAGGYHQNNNTGNQKNHANANVSAAFAPKMENASIAAAGGDEMSEPIIYSFMCEVIENIIVDTPIHETLLSEQIQEGPLAPVVFILDSGASRHLVKSTVPVKNKKRLREPVQIQVAKSDIRLKACYTGVLECESVVHGQVINLQVEVLIVEQLSHNLISISCLDKQGYKITFWSGECRVEFGNELVALGKSERNLYILCLNVIVPDSSMLTGEAGKVNVWHRRLGHIGNQRLIQLSKMVQGIGDIKCEENPLCDVCVQGKQTKSPFGGSRTRTSRPLERIHSDVCGPISPAGLGKVKYILAFIDDYTHFAVVFGLVKKSQVYEYFREYEARVTNRFDRKICNFRSDNGGEFVNAAMEKLCIEKGIRFELTIPGTPENNGVAERFNRTLLEKARCQLLDSNLSRRFWIEATLTAVYLLNRCPTRAIDVPKVPAELWYGVNQDVARLRVFGCVAYVRKPKEQLKGKFDSRSKKCIMLGYCDNGYRVWSLEESRIIVARDVIFDESRNRYSLQDSVYESPEEIDEDYEELPVIDFNDSDSVERVAENSEQDESPELEEFEVNNDNVNNEGTGTPLRRSTRIKMKQLYLQNGAALADAGRFVCYLVENLTPVVDLENFSANVMDQCLSVSVMDQCFGVPECFADLESRPDKHLWLAAVNEELQALHDNHTWDIVQMPVQKIPINSKWVFVLKYDSEGKVDRYKARLVVKGCAQKPGVDFNETYAPVAKLVTLRVFLCMVQRDNLFVNQLDVKNAFLNGDLKEEIYMHCPEGLNVPSGSVCRLRKTLYGLKQAPMEWNRNFDEAVKSMGFIQCVADKCIYVLRRDGVVVYLLLYVDDFLIACNEKGKLLEVQHILMEKFKMRALGEVSYFLGIKITRTDGGLFLSQESYVQKVLQKFKLDKTASVKTPLELRPSYDVSGESVVGEKPYRELIGSLMYASMSTRPDICTAVNFFSQFQSNATHVQWKGLKRVLRYLQGCKDWALWFKANSNVPLAMYVDADYANEPGRKSITGFVIEMYGDPILWGTRKQTSVALSSTEAEFIALATATSELLWIKQLLIELQVPVGDCVRIFEDNQSCIAALGNWNVKRMKHIDIKYNFVKDLYQNKLISVEYISSSEQKADLLTKGLSYDVFKYHRENLNMCVLPK